MKKLKFLTIVLVLILLLSCTACDISKEGNPRVEILLTDGRSITLELYPNEAPITVENFLKLIDSKYYDGLIFHRILHLSVIQAGGFYIEDYTLYPAKETESIFGEFAENGFENTVKHEKGVISMARAEDFNSASGQFFICATDIPQYDGSYAAFGKVVDEESLQVVLSLSAEQTGSLGLYFQNFPVNLITIETIRRVD